MGPVPGAAAGPSRRVLWGLALAVLLAHAALLLGSDMLQVSLGRAAPAAPLQLRVVEPVPAQAPARPRAPPRAPPAPRTADHTANQTTAIAPTPAASEPLPSEPLPGEPAGTQAVASEGVAGPVGPASAPPEGAVQAAAAPTAWPLMALGALPPSQVLAYQLSGMDKGLTYHASGELRWQHNEQAYDLTLSVKAFLLGSRQWRSRGSIGATGLAPRRFSDSWRQERAAHFDPENQRIVFSSNSTPAPLQAGAQDQVSLYVQLAAAMTGEPEKFVPGTRLQVQTATVRDALPWSMVLQASETLMLNGQPVEAVRWVCQPRNQYEARVEFWVTAAQGWLPVRIRITQASGSYIDLLWRKSEPLPPLPATVDSPVAAAGS